MCQMCEEYEAELRRMGLIEEARKVRTELHEKPKAASRAKDREPAPAVVEVATSPNAAN